MMSAAHFVAPEHTLLHQASTLSLCYKFVHVWHCLLVNISSQPNWCFQARKLMVFNLTDDDHSQLLISLGGRY